jgi:hypothetical protein
VRQDGPISASLAPAGGCYSLLDQEAAEPRVNQTAFDFCGGFTEIGVGQALVLCPTMELTDFEYSDWHMYITQ